MERAKLLPIPQAVPGHALRGLAARLADAITDASGLDEIRLGREAADLWTGELYGELTEADDDDYAAGEFTRRAAPYCLRIAGLHAALDGRDVITKDDLAAAGALVRYSVTSAGYVLRGMHRDPRAERLTRAITAAGPAGLSRTAVSALFSRRLPPEALDELLAPLLESGKFTEITEQTGGRPVTAYRAVPTGQQLPRWQPGGREPGDECRD